MYDLLYTLYENEEGYTRASMTVWDWIRGSQDLLRYNANKALMNLGQDPLFPDSADDVNPSLGTVSTGTSNHDFFSPSRKWLLLGEVNHAGWRLQLRTEKKKTFPFGKV